MPPFQIHNAHTDPDGYLWLNGRSTGEASIEPDQRLLIKDHTGKKRVGRIDLVEGDPLEACSIRIEKRDRLKFESVDLEGRSAEIKRVVSGADVMASAHYGPPRWWAGILLLLLIGGILWLIGHFKLFE